MPWTPLHAALGETTTALDYGLIERACTNRVPERADLDWKQQLPLTAAEDRTAKEHQQAELAKDIAAMANSGGGMIVYGVAETHIAGTSAADHVVPVGAVDETTIRAIRQVAGNLIYPPVTGLQLRSIAPADAPEQGVVVLLIPDSPEAPHLIHPRDRSRREWFAVPYRHGPDTEWMVERQIASAYQARETNRRRRAEDLDTRFNRFLRSLGGDTSLNWIAAMAIPITPLPRPRALRPEQAHRIIDRAWQWPLGTAFGPRDLTREESTRRSLQSYIRTGQRSLQAAGGATPSARVEVHGDGAVAVAFTRDGAFPGEGRQRGQVAIPDIEQTGMEFFALLWTARQHLSVAGDYLARITVEPTTQIFRRPDSIVGGAFVPFDESHRVFDYAPIDGPILTDGDIEPALTSWLDLVRDAVNQAGVASTLDVNDIVLRLQLAD